MTREKNLASVCNSHWFNVTLALDVNYYSKTANTLCLNSHIAEGALLLS